METLFLVSSLSSLAGATMFVIYSFVGFYLDSCFFERGVCYVAQAGPAYVLTGRVCFSLGK